MLGFLELISYFAVVAAVVWLIEKLSTERPAH